MSGMLPLMQLAYYGNAERSGPENAQWRDWKRAEAVAGILSDAAGAFGKSAELRAKAGGYGVQEAAARSAIGGGNYVEAAGDAQKRGMYKAAYRFLQAGQDIGRIYAGAAGSGIEVSSPTVTKTVRDTHKSAAWDVKVINENAALEAAGLMSAGIERMNALRVQAAEARANKKIARDAGMSALWGGVINSAIQIGAFSAAGGWNGDGSGRKKPSTS